MKRAPVKVLRHVCMKAIFAVSWCLWFSQWKILSRVQALAVISWTSKNNVETGNSSSAGLRCLSDFGWRHYIWGWNIILFICFVVQHFSFKTTLSNVAYVEDSGCIHVYSTFYFMTPYPPSFTALSQRPPPSTGSWAAPNCQRDVHLHRNQKCSHSNQTSNISSQSWRQVPL